MDLVTFRGNGKNVLEFEPTFKNNGNKDTTTLEDKEKRFAHIPNGQVPKVK